jgi:peptidyl-prolyl cis-trans isomerase SurA
MGKRAVRHLMMGAALVATATTTLAQDRTVRDGEVPETNLDIPQNLQIFGKVDPNVRKATAIVNDSVITATDVDQRMALILAANSIKPTAEDLDRLRLQVLRQLIDETLEIQQAKTADITIASEELDQSFARVANNFKMTPVQFRGYLQEKGSSERSIRRQIEGELAWQRYLRRRITPTVNVGDEEVKAIIERIQQAKGTDEYHLSEIYLSTTPDRADQVFAQARQILEQIQQGKAPFAYFARNFSEATTKATGGDLDWVRLATLPDALANAVREMQPGQVAGPVQVPGGFSILYLQDKRQVLMADPRDAKLSLKQITVNFRAGVSQTEANTRTADFANALKSLQGCGSVEKVAAGLGAEVVSNDTITIRQLPAPLQTIMLKLQVGEATPPFGSPGEGVRALVLCGRDDPATGALPSADQIQGQLEQERVNLRAQTALRDLRRDAVIEYR